jgi:5-methylcytosine-specific restriction endonuclease McrA
MSGRAICLALGVVWSVAGGFIGALDISRRDFVPVSTTEQKASAGRSTVDAPAAVTTRDAEEAFTRYEGALEPLVTLHAPPSFSVRGDAPLPHTPDGSPRGPIARFAILAGVVVTALIRSRRSSIAALSVGTKYKIKVKKAGKKRGKEKGRGSSSPDEEAEEGPEGWEFEVSHDKDCPLLGHLSKYRVLVMDASYRPVDVIDWKKGLLLDQSGRGNVLEYYEKSIRSARDEWPLPAVVVTTQRAYLHEKYAPTKMNIQARDGFTCQYCGTRQRPFTIDHVLPKSREGLWVWENLVCCCPFCNSKKGDRTPQEANMPLMQAPTQPRPGTLAPPRLRGNLRSNRVPTQWVGYIQHMPFFRKLRGDETQLGSITPTNFKPAMLPADEQGVETSDDTVQP